MDILNNEARFEYPFRTNENGSGKPYASTDIRLVYTRGGKAARQRFADPIPPRPAE